MPQNKKNEYMAETPKTKRLARDELAHNSLSTAQRARLRPYRPEDAEFFVMLWRAMLIEMHPDMPEEKIIAVIRSGMGHMPAGWRVHTLVAETDGDLVGFIRAIQMGPLPHTRMAEFPSTGYLDELYVTPGFRLAGVGRRLLEAVMSLLWELGVGTVWGHPSSATVEALGASHGASTAPIWQVKRSQYRTRLKK